MVGQASATADISDAGLMARLATGDVSALGPLHHRHAAPVTALLLRLEPGRRPEQAEELCQETFLTLLETAKRYQEQGRARSWILGIAVRKHRSASRRERFRALLRRRHGLRAAGTAAPVEGLHDDALADRQAVAQSLAALSPGDREVLVLTVIEGLAPAELARVLGISKNAANVRLHRARKRFTQALEAA